MALWVPRRRINVAQWRKCRVRALYSIQQYQELYWLWWLQMQGILVKLNYIICATWSILLWRASSGSGCRACNCASSDRWTVLLPLLMQLRRMERIPWAIGSLFYGKQHNRRGITMWQYSEHSMTSYVMPTDNIGMADGPTQSPHLLLCNMI